MREHKKIPQVLVDKFRRRLYTTEHKVGENNVNILGLELHNPVFFVTALAVIAFVLFTLLLPDIANLWLNGTKNWIVNSFDWLFISVANIMVAFCLLLIVSPYGNIRIGGTNATPDFNRGSWLAMLFAAGMGIGLMFWSVAEPLAYASGWAGTPLGVEANSPEAFRAAMGATMYHWGLHPWAIYAVVGLSLAIFAYNFRFPLTMRSIFYPLLKEKTWGWPGHVIDVLAVLATIFGLATSLGLGAQQAASGLNYLFGWDFAGNTLEIIIIILVTGLATISVARGIDGGIKFLSNVNMLVAGLLLLFVFFAGNSLGLIGKIAETTVDYVTYIIPLSNPIGRTDSDFFHTWTVFYWAWWISWSPFVGMFIARISKGRTVREFIISVMLAPTLVTIVWMTVFGQTGLSQYTNQVGELSGGVSNASLTLFQMLDNLPLAMITSLIAIILVMVFFVTSSDSGSLVIDTITSGGKLESPMSQRVFWAIAEGCIAIALLYGGSTEALKTIQAGSVSTGLPFTFLLLVMCVSLWLGLRRIYKVREQMLSELEKY
ncbi:BCCT family transporter [Psychrobacter sp. LV10R520-6]|uniref:BCCT family transporter n=1 Tax=Psychrobacter sp. LV10R520-6 TaxID=1415574 RepID=UPI0024C7E0F3|nr:BCCT family transporter [Psychrobacter sp. LV10R520-6]SNT69456.1 betaine/carnitine transporter, BCCT family [Psychrobacter sp. LV10R520-6]